LIKKNYLYQIFMVFQQYLQNVRKKEEEAIFHKYLLDSIQTKNQQKLNVEQNIIETGSDTTC
jgi:hypothetical protein